MYDTSPKRMMTTMTMREREIYMLYGVEQDVWTCGHYIVHGGTYDQLTTFGREPPISLHIYLALNSGARWSSSV